MILNIRKLGVILSLLAILLGACTAAPAQAPATQANQIPLTGATATPAPLATALEQATATVINPTGPINSQPAPAETLALPPATEAPIQVTSVVASQPAASQPAAAIACTSPAALTPALTEGPYFKANSPERASLLDAGMSGTRLILTGYVLTTNCQPVAHALLDFWQANAQGQYDNSGFTLRGHQFTDANGHYQLETVVPGLYPGRTEHIHVKVQAPNGPILTTQLFFPGVANNSEDGIYNQALLITVVSNSNNTMQATYNFIVR